MTPRKFLVVGGSEDDRMLYSRTITRKFPDALVTRINTENAWTLLAHDTEFAGAVVHFDRTPETAAIVKALRTAQHDMPIITLSGSPLGPEAKPAGSTAFLASGEWLNIGPLLQQHLAGGQSSGSETLRP